MSDVGGTGAGDVAFDPWPDVDVHVEWGPEAAALAAARRDAVVVVDVLSFCTTVSMAVDRGADVLALAPAEVEHLGGPEAAGQHHGAEVASTDRADPDRLTLSPRSTVHVRRGERVLLTSRNGGAVTAAARAAPATFAGCFRNVGLVAAECATLLERDAVRRVTVVPAGERWTSVGGPGAGLRPSVEDWLAAGAIVRALAGHDRRLSDEAWAAAASFSATRDLAGVVQRSTSGRELAAKGFAADVEPAVRLDAAAGAPFLCTDGCYRSTAAPGGGAPGAASAGTTTTAVPPVDGHREGSLR